MPKINRVFLSLILQNLNGRSVLDNIFFENDPFDEPKKMPSSKKFHIFRKIVKNENGDHNRIYPSLRLKYFTLKQFLLTASISSKNRTVGAIALASSNISRTFFSLCPTKLFNNSGPWMLMKWSWHWLAIARATWMSIGEMIVTWSKSACARDKSRDTIFEVKMLLRFGSLKSTFRARNQNPQKMWFVPNVRCSTSRLDKNRFSDAYHGFTTPRLAVKQQPWSLYRSFKQFWVQQRHLYRVMNLSPDVINSWQQEV